MPTIIISRIQSKFTVYVGAITLSAKPKSLLKNHNFAQEYNARSKLDARIYDLRVR